MVLSLCKDKRCKTCCVAFLRANNPLHLPTVNFPFCKCSNIIYLITCNICLQRYVGQTSTELHLRINLHRSLVNRHNTNSTFEILHFANHGFNNIKIEILDFVYKESERLQRENHFILRYKTLYPYGLNTVLNNLNLNGLCIYNLFSTVIKNDFVYKRGCRGSQFSSSSFVFIPDVFLTRLINNFKDNPNVQVIKNELFALKYKYLKKLNSNLNNIDIKDLQLLHLIKDIILYKIGECKSIDKIKEYFVCSFQQKSFDNLSLSRFFKDVEVYFPLKNVYIVKSFKYVRPFSTLLFNYGSVARNVDKYTDIQ